MANTSLPETALSHATSGVTLADRVVVILALALLPWLYLTFWGKAVTGEQVRILRGGEVIELVSLHEDRQLRIPGTLGESILEIRQGRIRFVNSPCRGKQCVHSGWLALDGEFAACLPNRISVQVVGRAPRYDAINF